MSSHVLENVFSLFSGKGAKRKRKVSECLHDVFFMHQESCPCHIFSLHYRGNFSTEIKRDVRVFLENEGQTSGKNSSERCLSLFVY